jgi:hypothetical protein
MGIDDDVMKIASELMLQETETPKDPKKVLDEAERIVAEKRRLKIKLTGKSAVYSKVVYDPVGVGAIIGLPIKRSWDFNPANPASQKQLDYLKKLGVEHPEGLSRQGAGKMIDQLAGRREAGLATVKQVSFLMNLGVEAATAREMTFPQASESIAFLLAEKKKKAG